MSLEAVLEKLTAAVVENNELLKLGNEGRDKALAAIAGKDGAAGGKGGKADTAKSATPEEVLKAFTAYLGTDDEAELAKRKAFVKEIITKLDAPSIKKISTPEDRARALEWLSARKKDKKFVIPSDEAGGDDAADEDDPLG